MGTLGQRALLHIKHNYRLTDNIRNIVWCSIKFHPHLALTFSCTGCHLDEPAQSSPQSYFRVIFFFQSGVESQNLPQRLHPFICIPTHAESSDCISSLRGDEKVAHGDSHFIAVIFWVKAEVKDGHSVFDHMLEFQVAERCPNMNDINTTVKMNTK